MVVFTKWPTDILHFIDDRLTDAKFFPQTANWEELTIDIQTLMDLLTNHYFNFCQDQAI